jgi:hypothetical protein
MGNDITCAFSSENRSDVAPISNGGSTDNEERHNIPEGENSDIHAIYDVLDTFEFISLPRERQSEQQYIEMNTATQSLIPSFTEEKKEQIEESKTPTILTFMKKQRQKHKKRKKNQMVCCESI